MGLASALSTALTGMTAAETQIDVVGNNLANSQTVGFKQSETIFATQFLRTLSYGSQPTENTAGTNPRQTGLGVQVAAITPSFTQGTIEISTNPSDLAIQGDGFFIVEGGEGDRLYTRNGIFKTNAENQLATATGQRLLGFGVDDNFQIQTTQLVPVSIPLGTATVAQATQNVYLEGILTPTGDVADTAEVIESRILGDSAVPRPDVSGATVNIAAVPDITVPGTTGSSSAVGGAALVAGTTYEYRFALVDDSGTESMPTDELSVSVGAGNNAITLSNLPTSATLNGGPEYSLINVYRRTVGAAAGSSAAEFRQIGQTAQGAATFVDNGTAALGSVLDESRINGNYSYLVTFYRNGEQESRPSPLIGPQNVINGRIHLTGLPTPPPPPADGSYPAYDQIRIYRNLASDAGTFYLVDTIAPGLDYTDVRSDAAISDLADPDNRVIDLDGPRADTNTLLTNIVGRDGLDFENLFKVGTLSFQARKGGRVLTEKQFEIESTSTLQNLLDFMDEVMGIQVGLDDPTSPVPGSVNNIPNETTTLSPGVTVTADGKIRVVSNNGVDNAISIGLSAYEVSTNAGEILTPNLAFGSIQDAKGQSAVADFIAYDSLGIPIKVRITSVLEERTGSATVYRWFADSPDNDPLSGQNISVGTGRLTFDGNGNFVSSTSDSVSIDRRHVPSQTPLEFRLDFSQISGLAVDSPTLAASRQDGSAAGTLSSFLVGEDGVIRGVFSNGVTRDLGQIRMARFANPAGLVQRGQNMYADGVNAGLPIIGNPGGDGIGSIVAGAVELSNTDIGGNLIDLVLATTQYRGNARVITAAQQMLDELLNLRR